MEPKVVCEPKLIKHIRDGKREVSYINEVVFATSLASIPFHNSLITSMMHAYLNTHRDSSHDRRASHIERNIDCGSSSNPTSCAARLPRKREPYMRDITRYQIEGCKIHWTR